MPQDFDRLITSSLTRRIFLASGMMGLLQSKFSWAQSDTSSVSRLVVPFEPGGISDSLGRAVAAGLKKQNSQSWVVENIPGAGGAIGSMRVAQSSNPSANLLHCNAGTFRSYGNRWNPAVDFDPLTDLQAVAVIGEMPILCLSAHNNQAKDLKHHLQKLQTSKEPLVIGTVGLRNTSHVLAIQVARQFQLELLAVPYKGAAPSLRGLLSQEIPMAFVEPIAAMPLLQSGKLKCLGISAPSPFPELRQYPTFKEQGLGDDMTLWAGYFVSAKIMRQDLNELSQQMKRLTQSNFLDDVMRLAYVQRLSLFDDRAQQYVTQDVRQFQQKFQALQSQGL
jgi:tripartite-type tricarboxylate transporter receptor subunit TctC